MGRKFRCLLFVFFLCRRLLMWKKVKMVTSIWPNTMTGFSPLSRKSIRVIAMGKLSLAGAFLFAWSCSGTHWLLTSQHLFCVGLYLKNGGWIDCTLTKCTKGFKLQHSLSFILQLIVSLLADNFTLSTLWTCPSLLFTNSTILIDSVNGTHSPCSKNDTNASLVLLPIALIGI